MANKLKVWIPFTGEYDFPLSFGEVWVIIGLFFISFGIVYPSLRFMFYIGITFFVLIIVEKFVMNILYPTRRDKMNEGGHIEYWSDSNYMNFSDRPLQ